MNDNSLTNITLSMKKTTDDELIQYRDPTKHEPVVSVFLVSDPTILEHNQNVLNNIRNMSSELKTFCNPDDCIDYITDLINEKVVLNISASLSKAMIPLIHDILQISVIYISSDSNEPVIQDNTDLYPKIRNAYNDFVAAFEHLSIDELRIFDNYLGITLASFKLAAAVDVDLDIDGVRNRQNASFMYGQILKDILLTFPSTKESKMEMIQYCREQYSDNFKQLVHINRFNQTYKPEKAVRWFTKDCFLYRLVNKALRLQDIDALYKMRFYIHDLQEQIFSQHIAFIRKAEQLKPFKVYRGFGMTKHDFENLKTQNGGFMSIAEFMSTSLEEDVARGFAFPLVGEPDQVAILLQIEVDVTKFDTHFTTVQRQSWIPDEEETLFTMGTVFRIQEICVNEEDISVIKLSLNGEEDNELKLLYELIRKNFMESSPLSNLAKLILTMGNYVLAEKYYHMLLHDNEFIADSLNLSDVYYYLARIYTETNQKDKVIEYYDKCLHIKNKHISATDLSFSTILSNLGRLHQLQGDYEKALSYFKQALYAESNASMQDQSKLVELYESLGRVYNGLQRYPEEFHMFQKALKIRLELYPKNHPEISQSYNNIATGYMMQKDFKKAIDLYKKAIQIQVRSLQSNHPVLADTYNNLASALYSYGKLQEAIDLQNPHCFVTIH